VVQGRGDAVVVVGHQPDCSEAVFVLTGRLEQFAPGELHVIEL
jgi:phosphohistidine phosphatase SixA